MCCLAHSIPGRKGSKSNSWRVERRSGLNMLLFRSRRLPEVQGRRVSWCRFVWWSSQDRIRAVGKGWVLVVRKSSDDVTRRGWDRGCAVAGTAAAVQPAAWSLEARVMLASGISAQSARITAWHRCPSFTAEPVKHCIPNSHRPFGQDAMYAATCSWRVRTTLSKKMVRAS